VAVLGALALLALFGFAASLYQADWIVAVGGLLAFWFYIWSWRRLPL